MLCPEVRRYSTKMKFLLAFTLPLLVRAANHVVTVAPSGTISYSPTSVAAAAGDTLEFLFASDVYNPP
jgi:plastocyanin